MKAVIIESPFKGDYAKNRAYLFMCIRDSINRGEAPFASHLFYTEVLDDRVPESRDIGINAGLEWAKHADYIVVYNDLGISEGMKKGIKFHEEQGKTIVYRSLDEIWEQL